MRRRAGRRTSRVLAVLLTGAVLTGCGTDGYVPSGPFRPLPEGAPPEVGPPSSTPGRPSPGDPAEPGSGEEPGDPNVMASGLSVPTGLVVLPGGRAVVGERDTGRLVQVFPDRSPARELMTVAGIDAAGDGGLLGLALSPTFVEDGLFYAYVSTARDNRVVRFPLGGTPNPVLTGIPRGAVHNGGGLLFDEEGNLLVGTGDTGNPALGRDAASLAGKVLRIDVFGAPVDGGPVVSLGHRDVRALCAGGPDTVLATDDGPDVVDPVTDGGDVGSPTARPVVTIPDEAGGLGGCTAAGRFLFLGALDGERIHVVTLEESGVSVEDPEEVLGGEYGRLRTVVLDPEGGLWITTSNRDGIGTPAEDDDKVLRILPPSTAGDSPL